jgi:hypothetical protein
MREIMAYVKLEKRNNLRDQDIGISFPFSKGVANSAIDSYELLLF